jgi:hypothetical protein
MKKEEDVKKVVKAVLKSTPDCWWLGIVNGLGFAVETKFGKGTTTANQEREIAAATQAGGEVWIVRETNVDEWALTFKAWVAINARNT